MERIFSEQLEANLAKGLKPFYLLNGQDLLLVDESKDQIIALARKQGFDEKIDVAINNETKWDDLFHQLQSTGLFSSRQIVLLNCPDNLTATQQKQLSELLSFSHSDLIFILHLPKFSKAMEKQAWFMAIENNGLLINCQTPDINKMPIWLQHRAKKMALDLENETIKLLAYSYEGNLLALQQALWMLQLRFSHEKITPTKAQEIIEQSAQFTPFQWVDSLLAGKIKRATRILNHLRNEEVQAVVLLRIIQKELMLILEMTRSPTLFKLNQLLFKGNLRQEFDRLKVWQNRRPFYQQAINRFTYAKLYQLIQTLADLEKQVKQEFSEEIWQQLEIFNQKFS
ncbi:DNA polymerase III subunit delta [Ursidibacter maritimus]|uniref:DNA polymerase III subunit delta n=1 Tax=Ursidibacter maritimus TaxID=1331689 RepID=A0A949WMG4_9PAST|nr:DNA polymerase III subunit delta [Ursidibacter maritimus]KAE9539074.1 DNA polymerase III subunit delta [Ursidibacter maritimus]MBV6524761.1 DNA polymerase III subunit delta [Ursidibacter maritimus]MBV6525984.1 DNA polymerase III subunit delta [Ursidibacter maritimus]MBV6528481.1 DNA polymerase III subunit delta [Ursidibacter maritimus]MBV6528838.1 DNA polymerase III subunit delta [Ursidibacter maritimus]